MKKILFLTILSLCVSTSMMSQSKIRYQGDVQIGYSLGPGKDNFDRINLDVINGIRINEHFSIGIGVGIDMAIAGSSAVHVPGGVIPVYLNNRGYLPISEKMSLVFSLDVGVPFMFNDHRQSTGFMVVPTVGVSFQKRGNQALTLSLGYDYMIWRKEVYKDAIALKFGYSF